MIGQVRTPSNLNIPTFLMNFPFTVDNRVRNNVLMEQYDEPYDYDVAFKQFLNLYHIISSESLVYLLPSEGNFQDQTYVANLGCYLPHLKNRDLILMSNFKSEPRQGEEKVGIKFFRSMGYEIRRCPYHWEGEADLKYIRDNIYIGGYGIRTDLESHHWMRDNFEMDVISIKMKSPKCYHFDCMFFALSPEKALVATEILNKKDLKQLEKIVEIVSVPNQFIYDGWTNCIRIGKQVFHAPAKTKGSMVAFKKMMCKLGYEPIIVDLSEFDKSGADLSCFIMTL